jgi:hypothetical protein
MSMKRTGQARRFTYEEKRFVVPKTVQEGDRRHIAKAATSATTFGLRRLAELGEALCGDGMAFFVHLNADIRTA